MKKISTSLQTLKHSSNSGREAEKGLDDLMARRFQDTARQQLCLGP